MATVIHTLANRIGIYTRKKKWDKLKNLLDYYNRGYENWDYDFTKNGELALLKKLSKVFTRPMLFDVGANIGCLEFSTLFSDATVHAFEISPQTYKMLKENVAEYDNIHPHDVGLSDKEGEFQLNSYGDGSGISSLIDSVNIHADKPTKITVKTTTGDKFCEKNNIKKIDFLKIDVEGAESMVLMGFQNMIKKGAIDVVQFEYGQANIFSKFLLWDYYQTWGDLYAIGKLYPNGVDFAEYTPAMEDFIGPNFVAVSRRRQDLIDLLALK